MIKINSVTCASWVPQGAAKQEPIKAEIDKEELSRVIEETKEKIDECDDKEVKSEVDEKNYDELEDEALKQELVSPQSKKKKNKKQGKKKERDNDEEEPKATSIEEMYDLGNEKENVFVDENEQATAKTDEETEDLNLLDKLGCLTMYASPYEDPLIEVKEDDDVSECENNRICSTDNLVVVGHVEGDAAVLEVYVHNPEERSFYVHHEILLPAVPLCTEWLNTDPAAEENKPGNLIAIGTMSPVIDVYDLDVVDVLEPSFRLGKAARKKKKIAGSGHKDAVISLSWNRDMEHILASGSADQTVLLWDLHSCEPAQTLTHFKGEVQALAWHPKDSHCLLTGACDKVVRLFDCRAEDSYTKWKLNGEVESLTWDVGGTNPYQFIASTDQGSIYCIDVRHKKPLWDVKAHESACTGVRMSAKCPGCLVSVSDDEHLKVWDIAGNKPELILSKNPSLGVLHCISPCPDDPFVFCLGGDNITNNMKVWDLQCYKKVRQQFCPRIGLPTREDEPDDSDDERPSEDDDSDHEDGETNGHANDNMDVEDEKENSIEARQMKSVRKLKKAVENGLKPEKENRLKTPKKFKKKKGGHIEKKRK